MAHFGKDILFEIADKLVYGHAIRDRAQFRKIARFMFVSRACKLAFLSQFSRIEDYLIQYNYVCGNTLMGSTILHSLNSFNQQLITCDLVLDKKWLSAMLIQNFKFKPKNIKLINGWGSEEKKNRLASLQEVSSMQCFSMLLELDGCGLDLTDYRGPELLLDSMRSVSFHNRLGNLDLLLGLNAKEFRLKTPSKGFPSLPKIIDCSPVKAMRTESVSLVFRSSYEGHCCDFPTSECIDLLSYVMSSCVNLKLLKIVFKISAYSDGCTTSFCDDLLNALEAMRKYVLPPLLKLGCFLQVECKRDFNRAAFKKVRFSKHKLFQWGVREQCDVSSAIRHVVALDTRAKLFFHLS